MTGSPTRLALHGELSGIEEFLAMSL